MAVSTKVRVPLGRVLALGGLSAFGPLASDLYLPALPQLAADLGASESVAQLTLSTCMVGLALGQLLVGPITDRVGRRRPLVVGVGLFALTALSSRHQPGTAGQGHRAGTASAVLGLLQFTFAAAVPPLASLGGVSPVIMAGTIVGTAAAAGLVFLSVLRTSASA